MTEEQWGRVDADGTVWVRTPDGERAVGQYPGASEAEALAYFARKYDDLRAQVDLLEQRIKAGQVSPQDAEQTIARLSGTVAEANAVGDLQGLADRLTGLSPLVAEQRAQAERARAEAKERARAARESLVAEAEQIVAVEPEKISWKSAGDRLRELFDQWKHQQRENRLDKPVEDQLWKRFSHARTTFDRKRRQYFGALDEQRAAAKAAKEKLVKQAEALAPSTDWGPTAAAFRNLMDQWKAAGRAARKDDDALWARFRAAQDAFFSARAAAHAETEARFRENLAAKEALLVEAEALLPITDLAAARSALRDIHERWESAGMVPRADMSRIDARLRRVEQAVRDAEGERWAKTNPEGKARAEGVVAQLEQALASLREDLAKAEANGNQRKVDEIRQSISAREEWLVQARQALVEFGG